MSYLTRDAELQSIAWIGGSVHNVVVDGDTSDGRLAVFRSTMRGGTASPVHVHEREDETVTLIDGTAIFWVGDQRWEVGAGDTVFMPRGLPHAYSFTSETADMFTVCNPAGMEEFFRAIGWDLAQPLPEGWSPDFAKMNEVGAASGQTVLGPPLEPEDEMPAEYLS